MILTIIKNRQKSTYEVRKRKDSVVCSEIYLAKNIWENSNGHPFCCLNKNLYTHSGHSRYLKDLYKESLQASNCTTIKNFKFPYFTTPLWYEQEDPAPGVK